MLINNVFGGEKLLIDKVFGGEVQKKLSLAQSIPVIGPVIISPIKCLFSLVQFIAGLALGSISGAFGALSNSQTLKGFSAVCFDTAGVGLSHLFYSAGNMLTLGVLGAVVEVGMLRLGNLSHDHGICVERDWQEYKQSLKGLILNR